MNDPKKPETGKPVTGLDHLWRDAGGEAEAARSAILGADGQTEGHTEETEAETPPENIRRISDPTLGPADLDATGEAIARATAANGDDHDS